MFNMQLLFSIEFNFLNMFSFSDNKLCIANLIYKEQRKLPTSGMSGGIV